MAIDGVNTDRTSPGSRVTLSYSLPEYWDKNTYVDDRTGQKSCHRIIIYQKTGTSRTDRLEKAPELGVARALDIGDRMGMNLKANVNRSKITSSQSVVKGPQGQTFFEYDVRSADVTFLFSATIVNERIYVCIVECTEEQYQRAETDLRGI